MSRPQSALGHSLALWNFQVLAAGIPQGMPVLFVYPAWFDSLAGRAGVTAPTPIAWKLRSCGGSSEKKPLNREQRLGLNNAGFSIAKDYTGDLSEGDGLDFFLVKPDPSSN